MKNFVSILFLLFACFSVGCNSSRSVTFLQSKTVRLSTPTVIVDSTFFVNNTQIQIGQIESGSQMYFCNDVHPKEAQFQIVTDALIVEESASLYLKTMGKDYLPSEAVQVDVFRVTKQQVEKIIAPLAKPPYNFSPADALIDLDKAEKDFRNKGWLGYTSPELIFQLEFAAQLLDGVGVSVLQNQAAWIFPPINIEVSLYNEDEELIFENQLAFDDIFESNLDVFKFFIVEVPAIQATRAEIRLRCLEVLPQWHPGSGNSPWLFIDEIFIL